MYSLLNKIETEKKMNYVKIDEIKYLEIELVKIKYVDNPANLKKASEKFKKLEVVHKNLHEIKNELRDYAGEFEMVGRLKIADQTRETHIRFRNIDVYETYINAFDQGYESEDAVFSSFFHKINTPQFSFIYRSKYGNGYDFKRQNFEYQGNNCFTPTKVSCFIICINSLTGKDYKQQRLDFQRKEKWRSIFKAMARIQPFCRANNINLRYIIGNRAFRRSVTDKNNFLFFLKTITFVEYGSQKVLVLIKP